MSDLREQYEGPYLESIDLPEGVLVPVTISSIDEPNTVHDRGGQGKVIPNAIIHFEGKAKSLIINKTNYRVLKASLGLDPVKWIGQTVKIQRRYLHRQHGFGHHNEMCIRVMPPKGTMLPKAVRPFMGQSKPYADDAKNP